jgi:hypothetical protein
MSPRQAFRRLADRLAGTALDRAVRRAAADPRRDFLICWNRGLGDVALCLVPIFARIRRDVPRARIVVVTRPELEEPFRMTDADRVVTIRSLPRDAKLTPGGLRAHAGIEPERFAVVLTDPDVNRWLHGRRTEFPPALRWDPAWDALAGRHLPAAPGRIRIGAHVSAETRAYYGYDKDWTPESWRALFARTNELPHVEWILFGQAPEPKYEGPNLTDLRGKTGYLEMASILRHRCRALVAPDSGVLATAYYMSGRFPLDVISLWSDPRQGILLQGCPSPNPLLRHIPLVGRDEQARNIAVDDVVAELRAAIAMAA